MDWCDVIDSFNRIEGGDVMLQRVVKDDVIVTPCRCGRQPQHIESMKSPERHWLECNPCNARTSRFANADQAYAEWEILRGIQQSVAA